MPFATFKRTGSKSNVLLRNYPMIDKSDSYFSLILTLTKTNEVGTISDFSSNARMLKEKGLEPKYVTIELVVRDFICFY